MAFSCNVAATVDSTDVSARLTGEMSVEAEESRVRVASFSYRPPGATARRDLIAKPVTIDINGTRRFTGEVKDVKQNRATGVLDLLCVDGLKQHIAAKDEAALFAITPGGTYHAAIFGDRRSAWEQWEQILSTVPGSYELDANGTGRYTLWAAKVTPDYTFTRYIAGTLREEQLDLDRIVNTIAIQMDWYFPQLLHREHEMNWSIPGNFCDWNSDVHSLPTRDRLIEAITGGGDGWELLRGENLFAVNSDGITFKGLPESGVYDCGGGPFGWFLSTEEQENSAVYASWTLFRRFARTVTGRYSLTVTAPQSVSRFGARNDEASYTGEEAFDQAGWEAGTTGGLPSGGATNALGDWYKDERDGSDADDATLCALNRAATRIRFSHRARVEFELDIQPTVDLDHTVRLEPPGELSVQAKVRQWRDNIRFGSNSPRGVTTFVLAPSQSEDTPQSDDPFTLPTIPSDDPTHGPIATSTTLGTHIGNDDTAPDQSEAWDGWLGNYQLTHGSPSPAQIYDEQFRIDTPDIEDEIRETTEAEALATYNISIPHEELADA